MTSGTQIQMLMRDMLFINWAVDPDAAKRFVDPRLKLDTVIDSRGKSTALASAVCFRVDEVRSSVLPLPRLSFEQVNYRIYVKAEDVPSVVFLDMKVNSRMVTTLTSFLRVPVSYEDIEIKAEPAGPESLRYVFESTGLHADVTVGGEAPVPDPAIEPPFITQRLTGYAGAGDSVYRIDVQHPLLDARPASVAGVEASTLVGLGLFTLEESRRPHSAMYVREALFGTSPPTRAW
jgi:uncharacterized protein YqjF (DUF2071 family)